SETENIVYGSHVPGGVDPKNESCRTLKTLIMFSVYAEKRNLIESTKEFNWNNRRIGVISRDADVVVYGIICGTQAQRLANSNFARSHGKLNSPETNVFAAALRIAFDRGLKKLGTDGNEKSSWITSSFFHCTHLKTCCFLAHCIVCAPYVAWCQEKIFRMLHFDPE
ncbi:hypothetical protein L9F63_023613, partial [Diploptera punctata]